ncbi:MAG TPA: hypothetical protein VK196_08840, partial [Magnetospirillum sp.]|nr:hypothetical protein [Magnetospirillum sp.]
MPSWPRLLLTAALMASSAALAQSPDPVAEKEARVEQLRQRAQALENALDGDVCSARAANAALLNAVPGDLPAR